MKKILALALWLLAAASSAQVVYLPGGGGGGTFTGGTITAPVLGATGCTTAAYSFTADTTAGLCLNAAANEPTIQDADVAAAVRNAVGTSVAAGSVAYMLHTGGGVNTTFNTGDSFFTAVIGTTVKHYINTAGAKVASDGQFKWSSTTQADGVADTGLARSGAGVLKVTDGATNPARIALADSTAATIAGSSVAFQSLGLFSSGTASGTFGAVNFSAAGMFQSTNTSFMLGSGAQFNFASATNPLGGTADVGFGRAAAGVVKTTDGSSGSGYIQNTKGDSIVSSSNYTNATATFSVITGLTASVTSARKYAFEMSLFLTESTAADGVKLDFNGGTATMTSFVATCVLNNAVGATLTQTNATTAALATVMNVGATTDANVHQYFCNGAFVPSSTNTFVPRAAQNAHSTGTLTILVGSWLSVRDMP